MRRTLLATVIVVSLAVLLASSTGHANFLLLGVGSKHSGSAPPPTGGPALDFSKPGNSQYLGVVL